MKLDINDKGEPYTTQRLIHDAARTATPLEWRALNELAHDVLDSHGPEEYDTEIGLLVNAICVATHKVVTMQRRLESALQEG